MVSFPEEATLSPEQGIRFSEWETHFFKGTLFFVRDSFLLIMLPKWRTLFPRRGNRFHKRGARFPEMGTKFPESDAPLGGCFLNWGTLFPE